MTTETKPTITTDQVYHKNGFQFWVHHIDEKEVYFARYKDGDTDENGHLMRADIAKFLNELQGARITTKQEAL